jgi:hypothetical protein
VAVVDDQRQDERALCVLGCRTRSGHPYPTDNGYLCCDRCGDRLRETVAEIGQQYAVIMLPGMLLPRRQDATGRPPKGFASSPPTSLHVISLRDPRTVALEPGDPHSAFNMLWWWATRVREQRGVQPSSGPVTIDTETATLRFHWDWILRQAWVTDLAQDMRDVLHQLRHAVPGSDPAPKPVGYCTHPLDTTDDEGNPQVCGRPLYLPKAGKTITCRSCDHEYHPGDLIELHLAQQRAGAP